MLYHFFLIMENHVIKKKALTFLPLTICLLFKTTSITILINLPPLQIWNQIMHSREWLKLKRTSSLEKEVICPTCSSRTLQSHLPQIMFNWLWNISKVEGSTTSLSNQCQHLVASQWKMFPDIQKETPVFSSCLLPCFHSVFRYLNTLVRPPRVLSLCWTALPLSQLSLTSSRDTPVPPAIFTQPFPELSPVCPCLSCTGEPRDGHTAPAVSSPQLGRGEGSPSSHWQHFQYSKGHH